MVDATIYRPGAILGAYPQREEERLTGLDRFFAGVGGWVRKRFTGLGVGRQRFIERVKAEERGLERLVDMALRAEVRRVREELQLQGLTEPLMARAFALIRETAARSLGMRTVAEGVEETDQREALERLGCDTLQGFLFSRAVPGEDARRMLEHATPWTQIEGPATDD